jgi:hypothetical protein
MLCNRCHTTEATVHISTVLHINPTPQVDHFCLSCAEVVQEANPLLHPNLPPLPVVTAKPVIPKAVTAKLAMIADKLPPESIGVEQMLEMKAKLRTIAEKLAELEPILRTFCERHGLILRPAGGFYRTMIAEGQVRGFLSLSPDFKTAKFMERGYYPEMPWALQAGVLPRAGSAHWSGMLSREVLGGIPFSELAGVLDEKLEQGFRILRELTTEAIIAKGQARPD